MTDAAGSDDRAPETESEPGAVSRSGRTVPAGAFVVALMVAAALAILAFWALSVDDGSAGGSDEIDDVRFAAGRFAERFLTFSHGGLDDWRDDVLALSTGGFAGEVDEVEDGLRTLIDEAELDAEGEVNEVFVGSVDRGTVQAVVVYDRVLRSPSGARDETDRYMQLTLLQVEGEWLVDEVVDIASAAGAAGPAPAPPTTGGDGSADSSTTSAPSTSEPPG